VSGIVGIVNIDGAAVDRELLRRMTDSLAFRGPDAQEVWCDGNVGFGHSMLRTTIEAEREHQPCSLDGDVWITADARIDARAELKGELEAAGRRDVQDATDVELVLHAYHAWGDECVQHLLGDFVFAIWDAPRRRLFCARDHFGVKPFYYAHAGRTVVFSNTLNCVRLHPAVSGELSDLAIADFLLFGWNQEPEGSIYRQVRSLPPASWQSFETGIVRVNKYWDLPYDPISYRKHDAYVEQFRDIFDAAVRDRVRASQVTVLLSGGVDSAAVAASAVDGSRHRARHATVRASTAAYDRFAFEDERTWAGSVASHLRVATDYLVADDYQLFEGCGDLDMGTPEPHPQEFWRRFVDLLRLAGRGTRVVLSGEGADLGISSPAFVRGWFSLRRIAAIGHDCHRYRTRHGEWPRLGAKTWLRSRVVAPYVPSPPEWIEKGFAKRLELEARVRDLSGLVEPRTAREGFASPFWSAGLFRAYDSGFHRLPLEVRHPFFDVRLVNFLQTVPPLPWLCDKELLRVAMADRLPDAVRWRRKPPTSGDPGTRLLGSSNPEVLAPRPLLEHISDFVDVSAFRRTLESCRGEATGTGWITRPISLAYWLAQARLQPTASFRLNNEN